MSFLQHTSALREKRYRRACDRLLPCGRSKRRRYRLTSTPLRRRRTTRLRRRLLRRHVGGKRIRARVRSRMEYSHPLANRRRK
jgi:hypothetical protein